MAEYLICIDLETTCFPSKFQLRNGWYQEIIEFGAVLIDVSNSSVEQKFQRYINPTEFHLTRGGERKLNISKDTLDENGFNLQTVLSHFGQWMRDVRCNYDLVMPWHSRESYENAYFCTWSNMDLNYFLPNECNKKNICYANYLKWWINGQEMFYDVYGRKVSGRLHQAANLMNTQIVGNSHGAEDDAETLAYLVCELINEDSCDFTVKTCR